MTRPICIPARGRQCANALAKSVNHASDSLFSFASSPHAHSRSASRTTGLSINMAARSDRASLSSSLLAVALFVMPHLGSGVSAQSYSLFRAPPFAVPS